MKSTLLTLVTACALLITLPAMTIAEDAAEEQAKETPRIGQPVLVTDSGQGNNATLIGVMLRRAEGVTYESKPLATVDDLEGMKSLVIGVGASTKGLGAAGLDVNQEMERTKALVETAKSRKIPVVGIHIGGMPRRGELSDGFNEYVFTQSDVFILYSGGNEDGFFTRLAEDHDAVLITVDRKPAIGTELIKMIETGEGGE